MTWMVLLAMLVAHPHPEDRPLNPFHGLERLAVEASMCGSQFVEEAEARGLQIVDEEDVTVDRLVVVGTQSPSGDWLVSVYLLRPVIVGFPSRATTTAATWWHHSMFEGKPRGRHCRSMARDWGQEFGASIKSTV